MLFNTEQFRLVSRTYVSVLREIKREQFPTLTSVSVKSRVDNFTISVHLTTRTQGPGSNVGRPGKPAPELSDDVVTAEHSALNHPKQCHYIVTTSLVTSLAALHQTFV